jgi:deoxyadenosine/deoxycytidine kinase
MYLVEGNVGAGKSTLLSLIAQRLAHIEVIFESVNSWNNAVDHGASLLSHFYQDPARWSYTMETFTMFTRIKEHLNEQNGKNPFKIIERSLYSGHYCFARNGYLQGYMTDVEWALYTQWFAFLVGRSCVTPHGFIYLQTDPVICHERALKRNRSGEESIPLAYLEQIHKQHENFLIKKHNVLGSLKDVPVLVLDASYEFEKDEDVLTEYLEKIQDFMLVTHKPAVATAAGTTAHIR